MSRCRRARAPSRLRTRPRRGPESEAASSTLPQPVAGSADGLQRIRAKRLIELSPKPPDIDIDHIGARLVRQIPRLLDQLKTGEHLARAAHQRLQERKLLRRKLDRNLAPVHLAPRGG